MGNSLPKNWIEVPFIELLEKFENGARPKGGVQGILEGVPSLGGEHLNNDGGFKLENIKYIPTEFAQKQNRGKIANNDILIVKDGATTGKVSYVKNNFPYQLSFVNEHLFLCRVWNNLSSKYIFYFLWSKEGQNRILNNFTGSAQGGINQKFAANTNIILPPLSEQERIVAKLDALFAQHVAMKKALERIPQLLKDFRQQVLINAVSGKLTETWRNNNPQNLTLEDIFHQQIQSRNELIKNKKIKKIKTFDEIQNLEKDLDTPKSWKWIRWLDLLDLNNLAMKRGPFGSALKKDFFIEKGVRVFEQYNPINDDPYFQRYYISEDKYEELKSFRAQPKDLLISCSGVTLGRITEIPDDTEAGIINQALLKVTLNSKLIFNKYFIRLFRSEYIQKKIFDKAKGSAIPNMVGVDILKKMPLPIPPPEEQQKILSIIESLFNRADTIEKRYKTLKEKVNSLPQAILHKAFKGELVPQLPTDGDAKDLLEEILKLKKEVKKK